MKAHVFKNLSVALLCYCCSFAFMSCSDSYKCNSTQENLLKYTDYESFTPYSTGRETLKFVRNHSDTQIFVGQGKETYYNHVGASGEGCAQDYECLRIRFTNQQTKDDLIYSIENGELHHYSFSYKTINASSYYKNSLTDSIQIGTKKYNYVLYYGKDSSSYIAARNKIGIIQILQSTDTLDLIP